MSAFNARGVSVERVISDNGSAYRSNPWRDTCKDLGITVKETLPTGPGPTARSKEREPILDRECALPVRAAVAGDRLEVGQALVTPSGHHTLIGIHGVIMLIPVGALPLTGPRLTCC